MPAWRKILWSVVCSAGFLLLAVDEIFASIEFTISNIAQTNDEIEVDVVVKGLSGSSCFEAKCYLQGVLTAEGQNQYFGFTQNTQSNWYEYIGSPEAEFIKSTFFWFEPKDGSWSGKLKVKNNPNDTDYKGAGEYSLQVRRYTGKSSSSAGESNTLPVHLSYVLPTPTPAPTSTPNPTSTPTPKPEATATPTSTTVTTESKPASSPTEELRGKVAGFSFEEDEDYLTASLEATLALMSSSDSASVAGNIETTSTDMSSNKQRRLPFFVLGGLCIGGSVVSWVVRRYNSGSLWQTKTS